MIPKEMNFFWSGSPMSFLRYMTLHSFRMFNPDWKMRLWTCPVKPDATWNSGEKTDSVDYRGKDYGDKAAGLDIELREVDLPLKDLPPAYACDLCEWKVLSELGGWFSDMDILYRKPMPEIDNDVDVVLCYERSCLGIGLLAGSINNQVWNNVYRVAIQENKTNNNYQACGVHAIYRAYSFTNTVRAMNRVHPDLIIECLSNATVYPFDCSKLQLVWASPTKLPDSVIGIHWFGGYHESQKYNNRINQNNYRDFNCTISSVLSEIGCNL